MKIGFTGTRDGMTNEQKRTLASILSWYASRENAERFVHGACIGADGQAATIAKNLAYTTVARPSNIEGMQTSVRSDINLHSQRPLDRNKDIVKTTDLLIACPRETEEVQRSGTWSTIRYALTLLKPVIIIYPDGSCK